MNKATLRSDAVFVQTSRQFSASGAITRLRAIFRQSPKLHREELSPHMARDLGLEPVMQKPDCIRTCWRGRPDRSIGAQIAQGNVREAVSLAGGTT
jgi:hypothetical protein